MFAKASVYINIFRKRWAEPTLHFIRFLVMLNKAKHLEVTSVLSDSVALLAHDNKIIDISCFILIY
jgi:hypothetical protein